MTKRRKFLLGMGSLAAGGAAAMGSGAFTSVEAERGFNAEVVADYEAMLSVEPYDGPNGDYASWDGNGMVEVDFPNLNDEARINIENVLKVENNGTQNILVNVALEDSAGNVGGDVASGLEVGISGDKEGGLTGPDFARLGPDYDGEKLGVGESAGLGFFFNYEGSDPQEDFGDIVNDIEKMWIVAAKDADTLAEIEDSLTTS